MKLPKRLRLLLLGLVIVTGAIWDLYPLPDASARLATLSPGRRGDVSLKDDEMEPAEKENFKRLQAIKRLAFVGEDEVVLVVADGTRDRHAIHDPEFCFRGAGWEITSSTVLALPHGTARLVHLSQKDGSIAEVVYWFTDGTSQFWNPTEYWWTTSLRRVSLGHSGQEPVLVMISTTDKAPSDWGALLKKWPAILDL